MSAMKQVKEYVRFQGGPKDGHYEAVSQTGSRTIVCPYHIDVTGTGGPQSVMAKATYTIPAPQSRLAWGEVVAVYDGMTISAHDLPLTPLSKYPWDYLLEALGKRLDDLTEKANKAPTPTALKDFTEIELLRELAERAGS